MGTLLCEYEVVLEGGGRRRGTVLVDSEMTLAEKEAEVHRDVANRGLPGILRIDRLWSKAGGSELDVLGLGTTLEVIPEAPWAKELN